MRIGHGYLELLLVVVGCGKELPVGGSESNGTAGAQSAAGDAGGPVAKAGALNTAAGTALNPALAGGSSVMTGTASAGSGGDPRGSGGTSEAVAQAGNPMASGGVFSQVGGFAGSSGAGGSSFDQSRGTGAVGGNSSAGSETRGEAGRAGGSSQLGYCQRSRPGGTLFECPSDFCAALNSAIARSDGTVFLSAGAEVRAGRCAAPYESFDAVYFGTGVSETTCFYRGGVLVGSTDWGDSIAAGIDCSISRGPLVYGDFPQSALNEYPLGCAGLSPYRTHRDPSAGTGGAAGAAGNAGTSNGSLGSCYQAASATCGPC